MAALLQDYSNPGLQSFSNKVCICQATNIEWNIHFHFLHAHVMHLSIFKLMVSGGRGQGAGGRGRFNFFFEEFLNKIPFLERDPSFWVF